MRYSTDILNFDSSTLDADRNSDPIWIGFTGHYAVQISITGSPVGTFKLQASLDRGDEHKSTESERGTEIQNWTDIECSDKAVSAAGTVAWNVGDAAYLWVRVVYTSSSGTGTISSARFSTKGG